MHFTYEIKEKIYKLRNKVNSTVKTMAEVAVVFDSDTGKIKEYGHTPEMDKKLRSLAEQGQLRHEMFRSSELNLEVFNKVINDEVNIIDVISDKTIGSKWFVSYYPVGWKPSLLSKKEDKPEKKESVAIGDTVTWTASSFTRQYKVVAESTDDKGKVFTLEFKGANFTAPEAELEKVS